MFHPCRVLSLAALAALVSFNLRAIAPTDFKMKLPIAVNAAAVGEKSATDLPVLVRLSESIGGFKYSDLASDGSDLAFGVDDGGVITVYPHEIDTWDPEGESLVWVKVPVLDKATSFNAYYGNGASGGATASATWSNYTGVWHFGEAKTLTTEQTANWPTAQAAYANSTAAEGLEGYLSADSFSGEEGRFGKCFRTNDAGCKTGKFNNGGVWVNDAGDSSPLDRGDTFTISGWFKHPTEDYYYDHIFYKRSQGDNKTDKANTMKFTGGFAIELKAGPAKTPPFDVRGGNATSKTGGKLNAYGAWSYLTFVFEGQKITVYENGVQEYSATGLGAATNNDAPLGIGTRPDIAYSGCTGDACWCGWIDEVRLNPAAASADYVALEYAAMATDGFLSFGDVETMDDTAMKFAGAPTFAPDENGVMTLSITVLSGSGKLEAEYENLATGEKSRHTLFESGTVDSPTTFTNQPELPEGVTYSFKVVNNSPAGTVSEVAGRTNAYIGELSVEAGEDADEQTLKAGSFVVSRADSAGDLIVNYTLSGGGGTFEPPTGTVLIPDGETSATIAIKPVYNPDVEEDAEVTLALGGGAYPVQAATAKIKVISSNVNIYARYVTMEGVDTNDGMTLQTAKKTVAAAVASLDDYTAEPSAVYIAPGIYPSNARIVVTNSVSLVGLGDDPSRVMLSNTANRTMLLTLNNPKSGVYNMTLAKGMAYQTGAPGGSNLLIDENGGTASNCWIVAGEANNYNGHGGGASIKAGLITHCVFKDNFVSTVGADSKAGGIEIYGGQVENCLIAYNRDTGAGTGKRIAAGVYIAGGTIRNCTIVGNEGQTTGGLVVNGSSARIENCLIAGNTAAVSGGDDASYTVASDAYKSCFVSCAVDATVAPNATCLAAATATLVADAVNGDCHHAAGSPAIDKGRTLESDGSLLDLDGNGRVQGAAIDIGCYEADPNVFLVTFDADVYSGILPMTVNFTATVSGAGEADTIAYDWDFDGDGKIDRTVENDPTVSQSYLSGGTFDVTLTVRDITSGKTVSVTKSAFLQFAPKTLYVNGDAAEHVLPFATPETGALSIQDAIDAAVDGCEIVIYPETYGITREILVEKALDIHGLTGVPEDVVVTRTMTDAYRIFTLNNGAAKVSGVVMENGRVNGSGGGAATFGILGGTISNAVIRGSSCYNYSGSGGAVSLAYPDAFVTHCVISNCWTESMNGTGGNKGVVQIDGGRVENSLITGNYAVKSSSETDAPGNIVQIGSNGSLVNCTVVKNRTLTRSIVLLTDPGSRMINSVVAGNEAGKSVEDETPCPTVAYGAKVTDPDACRDHCAIDPDLTAFKNYAQGDYSPKAGGPLYNAGVTPSGWEKITDLAGKPRVTGKAIDIGCYEGKAAGFMIYVR